MRDTIAASKQFRSIVFKNFILKISDPDNCCCLHDGSIIVVKNLVLHANEQKVVCKKFTVVTDFYKKPFESSKIGIFQVQTCHLSSFQTFDVKDIAYKCVKLEIDQKIIIFPLLHCANFSEI